MQKKTMIDIYPQTYPQAFKFKYLLKRRNINTRRILETIRISYIQTYPHYFGLINLLL